MLIAKIMFLFVAVLMTIVNTTRLFGKDDIPAVNFTVQAIGVTGFITLQWLI